MDALSNGPVIAPASAAKPAETVQALGFRFEVAGFFPRGGVLSVHRMDGTRAGNTVAVPAGAIVAILPADIAQHLVANVPPGVLAAATIQ